MPGETDLHIILKTMKPILHEGEFVFCRLPENIQLDLGDIIGSFNEKEGVTVIISKTHADELKLSYSFVSAWITLNVYSSLESVGLTAAVSAALAKSGISCNVVAAYFHDHIFVLSREAEKVMFVLGELQPSIAKKW